MKIPLKIYYVTGGMNPDTNPYVDSRIISRDLIIDKADLSESALAEIQELVKNGRVPYFEVYGMPVIQSIRDIKLRYF